MKANRNNFHFYQDPALIPISEMELLALLKKTIDLERQLILLLQLDTSTFKLTERLSFDIKLRKIELAKSETETQYYEAVTNKALLELEEQEAESCA